MNSEPNATPASTGGIIWTLARRLSMVVVLTLAFFLSALITIYIMFRSGDTRVPDVIGKSEVEARSIMEAGKFEIKIQRRTDDAPVNTVIETRPAPNSSVKSSSLVTLVISSGPVQNKSQFNKEAPEFLAGDFRQSTPIAKISNQPELLSAKERPQTISGKIFLSAKGFPGPPTGGICRRICLLPECRTRRLFS
jgi:hypothetical protein